MDDIIHVTIYFTSGENTKFFNTKGDKMKQFVINDKAIGFEWESGSYCGFRRSTIAGYYVNKKEAK